jgi:hypothetical protein
MNTTGTTRIVPTGLSRRTLLAGGMAVVGGSLLTAGRPARGAEFHWREERGTNGWPVCGEVPEIPVAGTNLSVRVLPGTAATVLLHCLRRYHYEIDDGIGPEEVIGHSTDRAVTAAFESNHLSGTAIAIRPNRYPVGTSGGFSRGEQLVIRDILAECEGVVRWGGDTNPVKESHFQLDIGPDDPIGPQVAARIDQWAGTPGLGAGAPVNPLDPARRRIAAELERRQTHR